MDTPDGEASFTFYNVIAQDSTFHATDLAIYAPNVYCRFDDGIARELPGIAAFSDNAVYYAKETKIYRHNINADDTMVLYQERPIRSFAVYGDKIALLFDLQMCALYRMEPDAVATILPPFHCPEVSSVGICNNKLVTASRKTITIYDDEKKITYTHSLPVGNDKPTIVNGPRCIVQSKQGNLYEFKRDQRLDLATLAWQPVCHRGLLYYIDGHKNIYRDHGQLKLADFRYLP